MKLSDDDLLAHVATRHYLDNKSRIEIAEELGISRFRVARLLEDAMDSGIVTVDISMPGTVDVELSVELKQKFGLQRAIAVIAPTQRAEVIQEAVGSVGADLLNEIVTDGDILGVTAGRTLSFMAAHVKDLAHCDVVQLAGVAGPVRENGVEILRRISRASGGSAYPIFAPLLVRDARTAAALRSDPVNQETFRRFSGVTKAVVAVGSWNPPESQLYDNARNVGVLDQLLAKNVQAEVASTLLDPDGKRIDTVLAQSLAISPDQLKAIPEVIALAGGIRKANAVLAAIRAGIINSLVTDTGLARRLLGHEPVPGRRTSNDHKSE